MTDNIALIYKIEKLIADAPVTISPYTMAALIMDLIRREGWVELKDQK